MNTGRDLQRQSLLSLPPRQPLLGPFPSWALVAQEASDRAAGCASACSDFLSGSPLSVKCQDRLSLFLPPPRPYPRPPTPLPAFPQPLVHTHTHTHTCTHAHTHFTAKNCPPPPPQLTSFQHFFELDNLRICKTGERRERASGSQDRKLVSHSSNCPKAGGGEGGEPKRSLVQTLPRSLFISPFELPVSSESREKEDRTGTLSAGSSDSVADKTQKVAVEGPGTALRERRPPRRRLPPTCQLRCGHPSTTHFPLMRTLPGSGYDRCCCRLGSLLSPWPSSATGAAQHLVGINVYFSIRTLCGTPDVAPWEWDTGGGLRRERFLSPSVRPGGGGQGRRGANLFWD